eukprot:superscaffoldBa00013780_g26131
MGTEFVQPMGKVLSRNAPYGVENVVMSLDFSAKCRSSYPTYKSRVPPQALPANASANSSVAGGKPECAIVTAFNGSKLWTNRSFLPSFLTTQNQRDLYDEFEGSYTPESSLFFIIAQTSLKIPGGILIGLSTHGT